MDCHQFKSVVALVDSLVRSAHARKSRALISRKMPSDFSIYSILDLETDARQSSPSIECHTVTSPPLSPYSDCASPHPSHRETSPPLTPYSDTESSRSNCTCSSESDQVSTYSEELPKKKRQRTTFSPNEVIELERAFKRQPYLIADDAELLAQRIGITAKRVKYWFQNRRAKSRRLERKLSSVCQTSPSNQFELPVSTVTHPRRLTFVSRSPADHWKQAECISYPLVDQSSEDQQYSRQVTPAGRQPSNKFNLFRGNQSFPFPAFHPDQLTMRLAEPTRLKYSRGVRKFQPY